MFNEKLVMIPGPTPVVKEIRDEMAREVQAFGDPRFVADFKAVIDGLGKMLNCSGKTFVVAGTGTLAMEMAIANSTKRGDRVLIVSHGFFGDRFVDICKRKGVEADVIRSEWGRIVPVSQIEEQLSRHRYAVMTVTHVDTSTGVCAPIAEIGEMMRKFPDTIYIVDGVCATGAEFEDVDGMNVDILFTGTQKAFGVCPGLLMLWAGKKALARRDALGETIPEYYCDFHKWLPTMDDPFNYFATPAVNLVWALKKSMELIEREGGLKARDVRMRKNALAMQAAFEELGLKALAEPCSRAITLSNLIYPEGIDDARFRSELSGEGVMVAGGLAAYAGKMFRIGHMGNIDVNTGVVVLGAIERTLEKLGQKGKLGAGVAAYLSKMA
ncbi:MAG: alanine--glyoxylate aminotransferase family protein [Synergistaceae bacterium]|nr:alanine--glyoxylate aminotransferase family protein [Synergistaceae bacterium]